MEGVLLGSQEASWQLSNFSVELFVSTRLIETRPEQGQGSSQGSISESDMLH